MAMVQGEARLIRAVTATNAVRELQRLERAWRAGEEAAPSWRYFPVTVRDELRGALERLAESIEDHPPLGPIYAARARELALELELMSEVASVRFRTLAARRFVLEGPEAEKDRARADALAAAWVKTPWEASEERLVKSDDASDPESLLSMLRAEIGRRQLPLRVVVQPGLLSLAAVADDFIVIAEGREIHPSDAARTVLHEIEAHALPRLRANGERLGIFALGTAGGLDDQEGRALVLERRSGHFQPSRLRELGFRHLAAVATLEGSSFVETVRMLREKSAPLSLALRIAARVQRGGGLAREIVYLPGFVRVGRMIREDPSVEEVMERGRVAASVAGELRGYLVPVGT